MEKHVGVAADEWKVAVRSVDSSSPANFANSVQMLDASFTPDPMDPNSAPGSAGPITNQKITTDLINAFNLAPQRLRDQLCGSGGNSGGSVFVQDSAGGSTGCSVGSWRYRKRQRRAEFI